MHGRQQNGILADEMGLGAPRASQPSTVSLAHHLPLVA